MNFSEGHTGTKIQCESCLFSQGKTPEFTKMGEIHELFVLPLSLVWFAGATPDQRSSFAIAQGLSPVVPDFSLPPPPPFMMVPGLGCEHGALGKALA